MSLKFVPYNGRIPTHRDAYDLGNRLGYLIGDSSLMSASLFNPSEKRLILMNAAIAEGDGEEDSRIYHDSPDAESMPALFVNNLAKDYGFMIDPSQYVSPNPSRTPRITLGSERRVLEKAPSLFEIIGEEEHPVQ